MQLNIIGDQRVKYIKYTNIWVVSGLYLNFIIKYRTGRDSVVSIATRYGLDGTGIEFRRRAIFSAPVENGSEAHPTSYTMGTGSLPGVKRPGRGVDHPPHIAPRLKKEYGYTSTPPLGFRGLL